MPCSKYNVLNGPCAAAGWRGSPLSPGMIALKVTFRFRARDKRVTSATAIRSAPSSTMTWLMSTCFYHNRSGPQRHYFTSMHTDDHRLFFRIYGDSLVRKTSELGENCNK